MNKYTKIGINRMSVEYNPLYLNKISLSISTYTLTCWGNRHCLYYIKRISYSNVTIGFALQISFIIKRISYLFVFCFCSFIEFKALESARFLVSTSRVWMQKDFLTLERPTLCWPYKKTRSARFLIFISRVRMQKGFLTLERPT